MNPTTPIQYPIVMASPPTGEHFEFHTSFRGPARAFNFTWTLAPGKKGPGEHIHPKESHFFKIIQGEMTIWKDDVRHDVKAGDSLHIPPGCAHRFANTSNAPCVVDVTNDGPTFEDFCIPLALLGQKTGGKMTLGFMLKLIAQVAATDPNLPSKRTKNLVRVLSAIPWFVTRVLRVKPLPIVTGWEQPGHQERQLVGRAAE